MFGFFKKRDEMVAPVTGNALPLSECSDLIFAEKNLGDGIVLIPDKKEIYAPVDGIVIQTVDTLHAICIEGRGGIELLIHLGIGTAELNGKGLKLFVELGSIIEKGDKIGEMDIDFIKNEGYSTEVPMIFLNEDSFKIVEYHTGPMIGGESTAISYKK